MTLLAKGVSSAIKLIDDACPRDTNLPKGMGSLTSDLHFSTYYAFILSFLSLKGSHGHLISAFWSPRRGYKKGDDHIIANEWFVNIMTYPKMTNLVFPEEDYMHVKKPFVCILSQQNIFLVASNSAVPVLPLVGK